ncbi:class I SAM-dependent methyltransferase [Nocardioides humi]|uniref:Class I SAM-dependent methyltransferase n=1 Tax=Nocardioides humi TaxID=449461 RepID=A0ABN1ZVB9_9ACTN|nr:class I SAM-dependent methyltransferase [Nocardioides humi]
MIDGRTLDGVSATTLWTLRNRAEEALRPDSSYDDPWAVRLYRDIDYDYEVFGKPSQSHPLRALAADHEIGRYLDDHPDATVVALAEGLQTSYWRLGRTVRRWLSVDLPPVVALREELLPQERTVEHLALDALDRAWLEAVDPSDGVVVTAEGLFMYLQPDQVRALIADIAQRFPGGVLVYDSIPRWFRDKTLDGLTLSGGYVTPPMPYAQTVDEARRLTDLPGVRRVVDLDLPRGRGPWGSTLLRGASNLPVVRNTRPSLTLLELGPEN